MLAAVLLLAACGSEYGDNILAGPHPMGEYVAEFYSHELEWRERCNVEHLFQANEGWGPSLCRDRGFGAEWNLDCEAIVDIDIRDCIDDMDALKCGPYPVGMPTTCQSLFVPGFGPPY